MPVFHSNEIKKWVLVVILGGVLCGTAAGIFFGLTRDLPQIRSLESFAPAAVTRLYSADGELLAEFFQEKRDPLPLAAIPGNLKAALVATEDRQFHRHSGVDLKAVIRAIIKDLWAGEFVEGASTITQQLAKTLFLTPRKTLIRKIKEAVLAFQLERRYTKDEILTFYLNQVYFGSGAYGVESAAQIFFGKSAQDLTLAECALIAGMPKSPSRYSPLVNPELAVKRRNLVLKQMTETGVISRAAYETAVKEPLSVSGPPINAVKAPYFVEYIRNRLEETMGPAKLYKEGLRVHTSLSYRNQRSAEKALREGLEAIQNRTNDRVTNGDDLQGALVSIDVNSGGILAMVGGRNFSKSAFNRAVDAQRQPGSAFKPIVYACAVENGFPQNRLILDAPVAFKGAREGVDWQPENFSPSYEGEMTLRKALVLSKNIPAVRLIDMLGPSVVARFGHTLGITSPLAADLTLALGTSTVSLLELTAAYAVFPNHGKWIEPWGILEIQDAEGRMIWRVKPRKKAAMSRAGAAVMTNMLVGVVQEGTARQASVLKRPLAGKTGTTDECRDALFVGFSPSIATGVWVGNDRLSTLGERETGARAALPIWLAFMTDALASRPTDYFDIPDDVVRLSIDPTTGRPAGDDALNAVVALFKKGTEP